MELHWILLYLVESVATKMLHKTTCCIALKGTTAVNLVLPKALIQAPKVPATAPATDCMQICIVDSCHGISQNFALDS